MPISASAATVTGIEKNISLLANCSSSLNENLKSGFAGGMYLPIYLLNMYTAEIADATKPKTEPNTAPKVDKPSITSAVAINIINICSIALVYKMYSILYTPWKAPLKPPTITLNGVMRPTA